MRWYTLVIPRFCGTMWRRKEIEVVPFLPPFFFVVAALTEFSDPRPRAPNNEICWKPSKQYIDYVGLGSAASASGDGGWNGGERLDQESGHRGNRRPVAASRERREASGGQNDTARYLQRVCELVHRTCGTTLVPPSRKHQLRYLPCYPHN